jgi:hypothetical protein
LVDPADGSLELRDLTAGEMQALWRWAVKDSNLRPWD